MRASQLGNVGTLIAKNIEFAAARLDFLPHKMGPGMTIDFGLVLKARGQPDDAVDLVFIG